MAPPRPGAVDAALYAVETRARARAARHTLAVVARLVPVIRAALRQQPGASGAEITSRGDVHTALTTDLDTAARHTRAAVTAAYTAGARLGHATARRDLHALGHTVTGAAPTGGEDLDTLRRAVDTAIDAARQDLQQRISDAVDAVTGARPDAARTLVAHAALRRGAKRVAGRVSATAAIAAHAGFTDAQAAVWADYRATNPYVRLVKVWQVRSPDPCPVCAALHGTEHDPDEAFDPAAGADALGRALPAPGRLTGPPRHPHCRCRLVYRLAQPAPA